MAGFGKGMLSEFLLDKEYTFLNHGSYGAVPKVVHKTRARVQHDFETVPDRWFRQQSWDIYKDNLEALADFVGTDPNNIVFTRNTTSAISTVLRHLDLGPGDKILVHSWTYGSMRTAANFVAKSKEAHIVTVPIRLPLKRETVIQNFKDAIKEHQGSLKFAIIDYICSVPPVLFPWCELSSLCQANNIQVLIDGAHAPGQVHLDLKSMDNIDYFVGNLHKWSYTHRGCAVLYVNPKLKSRPVPLAISGYINEEDWRKAFYYQGTDDITTYCAVKDALKFIADKGLNNVMTYNQELIQQGASLLVSRWGTHTLEISSDLEAPNMRMVRIPDLKKYPARKEEDGKIETQFGDIHELTLLMMDRFKIIAIFLYVQSKPYVRISANIYNCLEDYVSLAEAVLTLKHEDEEDKRL